MPPARAAADPPAETCSASASIALPSSVASSSRADASTWIGLGSGLCSACGVLTCHMAARWPLSPQYLPHISPIFRCISLYLSHLPHGGAVAAHVGKAADGLQGAHLPRVGMLAILLGMLGLYG